MEDEGVVVREAREGVGAGGARGERAGAGVGERRYSMAGRARVETSPERRTRRRSLAERAAYEGKWGGGG